MRSNRPITESLRTLLTSAVVKPVALVAGALSGATSANAQNGDQPATSVAESKIIEDIGAAERVEAADQLRTLAQTVTASACYYFNGIEADQGRARMLQARAGFRRNFDAILNGNPAMNIIGGETRRKTIETLNTIDRLWAPMDVAIGLLAEDRGDLSALNLIKDNAASLFAATERLVGEVSGTYANPAELLLSDVIMLDLSGRQGMLSQKITGNACKVWTREETEAARFMLIEDIRTFETGLNALRYGKDDLGLKPAPTAEIADGLDKVLALWGKSRGHIDELIKSGTLNEDARAELYEQMNEKTKTLDDITKAYVVYSKHRYD